MGNWFDKKCMICFISIISSVFYIDNDDGAIEKPLFSDNDDENENDEAIDTERWRNERFQRESYLSEVLLILLLI